MKILQAFVCGVLIALELILLFFLWTAVNKKKGTGEIPKRHLSSKQSNLVVTENDQSYHGFSIELAPSIVIPEPVFPPVKVTEQINSSMFLTPSVILGRSGPLGIGEQLYRYAFAYSTAKNLNTTLYLAVADSDISTNRKFNFNERLFALDLFNIDNNVKFIRDHLIQEIPPANQLQLNEVGPWNKTILLRDKIIIVDDYWQSEMYFAEHREEIKKQFVFKPEVVDQIIGNVISASVRAILNNILFSESVAVHIRRRDFIGKGPKSRVISISYQIKAMRLMINTLLRNKTLTFFIFSDDILYVRNALKYKFSSNQLIFMQLNSSSLFDFYLMNNCKHFVTANSGFSWWAAYLGNYKDKYVVAPFPRNRFRFYDIYGKKGVYRKHKEWIDWNKSYPENWITLNPFESYEDSM